MCYNTIVQTRTFAKGAVFGASNASKQRLLSSQNTGKEVINMVNSIARGRQWAKDAYWSAVGMATAAMMSTQPVWATAAG